MAKKAIPSLQASDAFLITPSNSADISADSGNTNGYTFCYVHNGGASGGTVKVDTVEGGTVTMYVAAGGVLGDQLPIMVRRVYATGTTATPVVALIGYGGSF